jgi:BsuBI/PstI restriction endonuclease domain/BsuBI/PstI restriction endonuclease HTH domain
MKNTQIANARSVLKQLGLPRGQLNDRSALTLLALLQLEPTTSWSDCKQPLMGVTPIMDWIAKYYDLKYAPNTRETIRRQTLHQFLEAAIVKYNPDDPSRAVNSPHAVYQVSSRAIKMFKAFGTDSWQTTVTGFLKQSGGLAEKYASPRKLKQVHVTISDGLKLSFSPGKHSQLISAIVSEFASRFAPGGKLIYAGDTGQKFAFFDETLLSRLGVAVNAKGKMPDVVLYFAKKKWLLLIEAVTSHGPVDAKRHSELAELFKKSKVGLVYVTAFPDGKTFSKYLRGIAWETEVWQADNPDHLIHFNGKRFLGPY